MTDNVDEQQLKVLFEQWFKAGVARERKRVMALLKQWVADDDADFMDTLNEVASPSDAVELEDPTTESLELGNE